MKKHTNTYNYISLRKTSLDVHPLCKINSGLHQLHYAHKCTDRQTNKQKNKKTNKQTNKQDYIDYLLTKYTALFLSAGGNWVSGCSNPAWVRTTNRTRQSPFSRKFRICDMFSSWLVILDHLSGFTCMVTL